MSTTTGGGGDNRKRCSLNLSLMNRKGVRGEHFGDATAPLAGLRYRSTLGDLLGFG